MMQGTVLKPLVVAQFLLALSAMPVYAAIDPGELTERYVKDFQTLGSKAERHLSDLGDGFARRIRGYMEIGRVDRAKKEHDADAKVLRDVCAEKVDQINSRLQDLVERLKLYRASPAQIARVQKAAAAAVNKTRSARDQSLRNIANALNP